MRQATLGRLAAAVLAGTVVSACQTPEQSMMSAQDTCVVSGYRPGTRSYNQCVQMAYRDYQAQSQATSNAIAAGAAAGLIGGAVVAASSGPYYGSGVYVGPGYGPYYGGYYGGGLYRGGYYRGGYYGGGYYARPWRGPYGRW